MDWDDARVRQEKAGEFRLLPVLSGPVWYTTYAESALRDLTFSEKDHRVERHVFGWLPEKEQVSWKCARQHRDSQKTY